MNTVKDAIGILEASKEFQEWKKSNQTSYLSHCFRMVDDTADPEWQIGFYNNNNTITTFIVSLSGIETSEQSEVFKYPGSNILPLISKDIVIDDAQAVTKAKQFAKEKYSKEILQKEIIILQCLEEGQVYNITFLTMAMNTVNIKIDSKEGNVVSHKITSLMDMAMGPDSN
jgi:hypothetical protein